MTREIVIWPDGRLFKVSLDLKEEDFGANLHPIVEDMIATMKAAKGVGLSAIQIGLPLNVMVLGVEDKREVLVNSSWVADGDKVTVSEGCLSVPGVSEQVERYSRIKWRAFDEDGQPIEGTAEGLRAQVIQHESEHISGHIFLEHLDPFRRDKYRMQMKKLSRLAAKQKKTPSEIIYGF